MLSSIFDTCTPRDEILAGDLSLDVFAAKLRLVVEGAAPQVYQNPQTFFANTFPTDGLKTLIAEVFGRLAGVATVLCDQFISRPEEHSDNRLFCAELAMLNAQVLMVNLQMVVMVAEVVLELMSGYLKRFATCFDLTNGVMTLKYTASAATM